MVSLITPMALGWLLGTASQLQQPSLWPFKFYLILALAAGLLRLLTRRSLGVFVAFFALAFAQVGARSSGYLEQALDPALEGRTLQVEGVIASMPQRMGESLRFRFDVLSAPSDAPKLVPSSISLGWYGSATDLPPADLQAGDVWRFNVRLKAPHGHINPNGFDYELWLWEQGLQATGYVRHGANDVAPQRVASSWQYPVERVRQSVRSAVEAQLSDRAISGVVSALLVGDQSAIDRSDWDIFRATGVAHLMSISGLHITGMAWLATLCVSWLWRRSDVWSPRRPWSLWLPAPVAASLSGLVVALMYAVFTGWGVPAQRTVCMLAVVTLLRISGRSWPWPVVWLSVCAAVVAFDPWAMLQAGFWLSFVAVAVLFASGQPTSHAFWRLCREQWLMSVCLAPLSLLFFHQISVIGLFANLLAVPWVTLVVTPLCLLGLVFPWAWSCAGLAIEGLMALLTLCASFSWAQWSAPASPWWAAAAALLGMAVWALRLPMWARLLGVALVLPALSWQTPRPAMGSFDLLAADMGQGHAVLVRTANHSLLYDTGPRYSAETDAGQRVLVPLLRAMGERLDRLVISHQDSDHSGGAATVMAMQPQADVLTSIPSTHAPTAWLRQQHTMQRCKRGQTWTWDGVVFTVLHPTAEDYAKSMKQKNPKPNALSCVLHISALLQSTPSTALLAGDIEAAQEMQLIASGAVLKADWLLVPHHGSATSSTVEFLQTVEPRIAVVQAGYRNRFGHPRADVMARYDALGVQVVQSPRCGASLWHSQSPNLVHCERSKQQHYWQHPFP